MSTIKSAFSQKAGRAIRWPVLILANVALLLVLGASTARESYRGWKVDQEIHSLESQIETLERKKMQLGSLIERLQSQDMIEREVRAKLGMRKDGERVIVLDTSHVSAQWSDDLHEVGVMENRDTRSNPEKWFAYFFRPDHLLSL